MVADEHPRLSFVCWQSGGDGTVTTVWRGLGPPAGSTMYGGSDKCNLCHAGCEANDFVCSEQLQLQDF